MLQSHHGAQSNLHAAWFHKQQRNAIKSASISNAKMWRIINKKVIRCDTSKWYPCRPRLIYKNCVANLCTWIIYFQVNWRKTCYWFSKPFHFWFIWFDHLTPISFDLLFLTIYCYLLKIVIWILKTFNVLCAVRILV